MGTNLWKVYLLRCADGTLYTGITSDLDKRIKAHNEGHGARYTRSRRPVHLVYSEPAGSRSAATLREAELKKLTRHRKIALIAAWRRLCMKRGRIAAHSFCTAWLGPASSVEKSRQRGAPCESFGP